MYDEQDRKYFYEEFKKNGYQVGSYDDFKKDLNNKEDRDWYYNEAKSMGYDVGSSQDFDNMVLEPTPSSSTSQAASSSTSVPTSGQPVASGQQPQTLPTQQQTVQQKPVNAPVATNQVEQPSSEEGKTGLISQAMGMIPKGVQTSNGTLQPSPSIPQSVVEGNQQEEVATPTRQVKPDVVTNDTSNDIVAKYGNYLSQGGDVDALQQTASDLLADGRAKTPEEAIEMAKQGLFGTADILAKQTTNQFVSSLDANNSGMVDNAIDAQWYSHDVQDKLKDEATRMGISYDDYIAHFVKPAMVESLVEKYGSNYRKIAEDVATRLYAHEGDVDSQLEQNDNYNDAASIINQFIKQPVADAINKAEAEANSYLQKYNDTYSGFYSVDAASPQTATAMGEYNKMRDPQKVLNSLTKQLSGIVDDPDFTLALVKVMDKRGYSYDKIDDFVKTYVKPMLNASIKGELDRLEMKKLIPHNSFEYIMKTGLGNTIVGKVSRKLMQTDYQNWLEDMANQQYQPGFWENVASGALTFAGDAWSYWLPGAAGGKLTKAMLAKAEGKLAGDLMAKGMERKMAERAAKMLVGRSKTTALKTGAAHGAVTFGGQSAISTPINEVYRDGQFDENGKPYHTSVEKVLAKTIGEVTKGAALGTIMQGGTLANMIGKGRGLAANILADVGGKAVDSSIMTGQALIEHMAQDPNFKPTGKDAAESFLESMANLTAIGLPGMMGKYAHFKDAREFNRKYDFNDEDLSELRRFGYDDLRTAFEDLGINGNQISGNAELMGQLTQKYMNLMSAKSVPEVLKAKMMAVVEGKRPQSFSPVIDSIIVQPMDGKVYLETLNKDGGIIDRKSFSSYDEAKKAEKSLDYEKSLNLTSAYENAYHTDALQEHLDDVYAKAREKYGMGEGLTDEDKAAIYLHQNANAIGDIMQKQQSGMELTEQEQQLLNGYRHFYDSAFENSSIMRDYVRTFEDSQGVPHGTLREALEGDGKKRTEKQQKLVEAYQKQLYNDIVLKREMKQTVDDLYRQSHSEGQKQIGQSGVTAEGENPTETTPQTTPVEENGQKIAENVRNIAENSQEVASGVPPTEPPTTPPTPPTPPSSSVGGETPFVSDAYKRGQDAVANVDSETLTAIDHADDVAEARLQRAFKGNETLLQTIYNAIDEGKDMELFIAQKANMLNEVQRDAIRKYADAHQAKQGVLYGIDHADDGYAEAMTEQLWPYATEDGNIVPVTLLDGTTAFLKKANEYGGTFVTTTDENGQPTIRQIHTYEIKEIGNPIPFQDYVNQLAEQNHAATVQKFTSMFDGSNLQPGQTVEIAMEPGADSISMSFAGYTQDGRIVLSDGKDQIALTKEEFAQMRNNAMQASINAELDAEEVQRENDAVAKAETEKKQRFADGIVGYEDGKMDYSSKESDPKVVAEYLQDEYGEDHGKLLSLINGSRADIKEQLDNKRKQAAEYEDWLDTNADLDPSKVQKVTDELNLVKEQMDDLSTRYKNWNTIRNSVMTPDEIMAMKDERTKTIKDVGVDESAIAPSDEREVSVLSNDELKKQYPTLDEASNHIASERKRIYDLQSNEVQPQIDVIKDVLEQYKNGEIELEPEQIKEINTTKAQLEARQQGLTDSAKELKAQAGKLNRLYKDELDAEGMSNLGMTPSEQRREQVKKALAKGDMNAIAQIYKDAPTDVTDLTPQTLEEAISERLPVHGVNAESLQQELGKDNFKYGIGKGYDSNKFNYLLAKKGEGETVASISKRVWENLPPNLENMGYTDQDVRNALLDMFKTYDSVKDMMNVALINRIAQAENELSTEEEYYEAQKDREIIERQAEIEAFDSFIQDKAVSLPSESELNNIYGMEYDQIMFEQERENQYKDYVKSILPELSEYDDRRTEAENAGGGGLDSDTARRGVVEGSSQGEEAGRREVSDKSSPETTSNQVSERRPETGSVESSEGTVDRTSHLPQEASFGERLKNAIAETETEPTEAQKKAGNYKKGHLKFGGYDFTVETPKGVTRSGKDENGKPWSVTMHDTYGYVLGKIGVDGDHIDMFINDAADLDTFDGNVFVIDQVNPKTGEFDEHKVMYGYPSEEDAKNAYLQNYSPGWKGLGEVTSVPKATFDKWLQSSDRKTKPFADYAIVKKNANQNFVSDMEYTYENDVHPSEEDKPKMLKFAERLLNFHQDKEDKPEYGYTMLSSNIRGDKLYPSEKKWFGTHKYRQGVSWVDKDNVCAYELNPRFNSRGYLTAVGVHKLVPLQTNTKNENQQPRIRFSKVSDEQAQLDADYLDAVNRGDMEKAQKMVNEAAEAAGYSTDSSYQGTSAFNGSAPWGNGYFLTKEERKEAWDNDEYDGDQTLGDYIHRGIDAMNLDFIALDPRNYRAADPMRKEAIDNVRNAIQKKSETITMYRSVPSDVKEGSFRNGDWVTPSRAYAVDNAKVHGWGDNFNIIEQKVPVDEIWWDGNDIAEWGYGREEDYVNDTDFAYKNTKNNRKLLDAVTYDDKGNVIPLSQRFNSRKSDERYQKGSSALKPTHQEEVLRDAVIDKLRESGMDVITDVEEGQRVLDAANQEGKRVSAQAILSNLNDVANFIRKHVTKARGGQKEIFVPQSVNRKTENILHHKVKKHLIDVGGLNHAYKNHGENGKKLGEGDIPLAKEDMELAPYILIAPDEILPGSESYGRQSVRYVKHLSNGRIIYIEAEGNLDGDELVSKNMWANIDPHNRPTQKVVDAHSKSAPKLTSENVTLKEDESSSNGADAHSKTGMSPAIDARNVIISTEDAAKIRKDAETAIENDRKMHENAEKSANGAKFLRTPDGEAYGYTVDGKIYIDPRIANSETPIHEYAHLWAEAVRSGNSKEWENIVNLMKGLKPVWDKVRREYPHLETDSDIADEVLAQYSGKRGAERIREEYDAILDGDGSVTEKAKALYALQRLKNVLSKFWKKVADFLHIHFTTAEEVADRVMKDLLDGIDPREAAKAAKASRDADKTMFGMHNISLDKLRKAIKQGGFAAPSMGVIDSKNGIYSGFGEITLIPKAEKIAKRTGKNIGTYAADAWTPIYPPVEKKFGGKGGDVAYDDIESVPKEMQGITRNAINGFMDGRDANSLAYLYLHEKGKAPELVHVEGKYPKELHDEVKGILGKSNGIYNTTDEQKEKLLDLFIREVYDGNREEFDNDIKNFIKKDEEFIKKRPNSNIAKNKQLDVDWMKEHGYDYGALSRFVDGILRDAETSGKVDENATMKAAQQYIQDNGMKEDFDSWKEKLNDRYNVEEVIFAGYKADGNRKYLPNTVENAVKVMKQDGKNASVGSASFSHFVASILKPMGTLDQIRKKKGNLTDNYEDVEKFQEKWQPVYDELADKMQPDAGPFESYGMDRLEEAATQKNPKKYAKDEYGVDLTDEDIDKLNELIDAVKNEKPSIYFETKFIRPYGLDEFEKAIVPKDTPKDVVDALKKAGIDVHTYDGKEEREKVTMDAINNSEGIRFMFAGEKGAAEADKAEEQTIRMDNLQVAKAMENNALTPKVIKFATGWERGADGKWRYEIPDFKSEKPITVDKDINIVHVGPYAPYNEPLCKLSDLIDDKGLFDAYPSLKNVDVQMVGKTDLQGMYDNHHNNIALRTDMFTVEKKYSKPSNFKDIEVAKKKFMDACASFPDDTKSWADDAIDQFGGYTEDELKADELFNKIEKDMPKVAKVVRLLNAIPLEKGVKFLGTQISLNDYGKKVLAHEVQHAIQYIEGFAKGGNSNDVRKRIQKIIDENSEYADYALQKMKTWVDFKKTALNLGKFKGLINSDNPFIKDKAIEYYWDAMNLLDGEENSKLVNDYDQLSDLNAKQIAETGYHVDEAVKELNRLADEVWKSIPEGNKEALGINNKLKDVLKNLSDDELYYNLAGEVEARNVMSRMGMTDEERRNSLASDTEDVDRGDQIVMDGGGASYSVVTDPKTIKKLDNEDTVKVYRAMQLGDDGKLYPPMAAKVKGKFVQPIELGKWEQADERPELADDKGMFTLNKGNGKSLKAAYNPYLHTSRTPLNDQFSEAQNRPNIVTVEVEVPKSELTSGYKADKAKDAVGEVEWKAGIIQGQLTGKRKLILSRWDKPVRIVPDSEVADVIVNDMFKDKKVIMPSNVVTPSLRKELEKLGVPFVETDNKGVLLEGEHAGTHYSKVYGKKAKKTKARLGDGMRNNGSVIGKDTLDVVKNVANTLGGAEANVYASVESVPEEYRADVERGAKGWYDPSNHTVHVYLPNCEDANDAQRTVFHEKVGHEGMEVLLGGEQGVRDFANFVYKSVDGDTRGKILDFANKYDPEWKNADRLNEATQEYIAHLAEDGPKTAKDFTLWTKMKHYLIKALKKLGIRVPGLLNDKDLRYYLMKAGKALHVWDNMSKDKQDAIMRQATGDDIKNALSDKGSGKPRMKKGESPIQYMKRVREWQRWKDAREDTNDPEPPQFYDIDKDVEGKKEWEQLNKDWRDRHGLVGDDMPSLPKREEGESDESFFPRYKEYEKWQNAINDKEDPMPDMFAWEKQKQVEATQRYEDWLTRHELNEQETADLDLYEGKVYPAETSPEAADLDKRVMDAMAEVTSTDVSKEGAARTVKHAVIHRRKNMEEASADDAIYINDIKRRIEGMAGSGVFDKLYSEYKGKSSKADALAEAIPYIIEAPRRIRDLAFDLNSTGVFAKGHIHITPKDVRDIQPYIDDFEELIGRFHYKTVKKGNEEKLVPEYDDVHAVSEQASKIANAINENHKLDVGFVPLDGTDILSDQVKPLIAHTRIVPKGIEYENLSEEMKSTLDAIHDWYNYTYDWLKDNHTLREDTGFTADYVNHIWDKEKSNPEAYKMYVENRQRTKSPNEKPRTISTLMEGINLGLVPKTTDITKMMAYYSRSNIEAWANKTMLQEVSGLNVVERDENGDIISSDPILSSVAPFNLEQYKYFEVPGIGPVWVYNVSPKQVKVKNPITGKEHVPYSEKSAADRFGVVFDTYESSPFWRAFDTAASSAKKLELGFSGFHAGALTEVYMVQNMTEFGPKKAMAYFMKYIMGDTMRTHQLPCFANPEDFQEAASHLVKFGATNDYAAADVQNMFDSFRNAMQGIQDKINGNVGQKVVGTATLPFKVASEFLALTNKGMDVALWDFLHDGLKLATYKLRSEVTKKRAQEKGWTEEQLSKQLDEDGQFVNDMFGGQHWDVLGAGRRTLRYAGRVLLSPDWNASTTRHFLAMTGFGSIWNEATLDSFKNYYKNVWAKARGKGELSPEDEGRRSRQISALLCYGIGFSIFYEAFANGINAAFRAMDEEKEKVKADEMRKTNPNYKSPYELAYPDGMKWYDYLMRGNALGQQTKVFIGHYADNSEMYVRHGKQFREIPEYFVNEKGELEFPGPMINRLIGKANPIARMVLDDINYARPFNASNADKELQRKYANMIGNSSLGKTIGLLHKNALYWAPFLIPSQENKEFKAVDFFFPSSKGFSNWKAQDYFKNFILSGDMEGVFLTYQSCQRNGIDAEKQLQAAISSIKALESKEMQDGVTSLQIAIQRFDEAKSVTEKRKMREKMRKFLSQSEYKAFTWQEAKDMVDAYQQGEDIKDLTKADDKYLMVANAEDVTEDWRIQSVKSSTKPYADRLAELKDSNSSKAQAFKETYARIFKARQAISRATSKMNRLKKKLGKENDKTTLQEIRAVRKELLKNLNGMENVKKLE
jgi:hypothetical protein